MGIYPRKEHVQVLQVPSTEWNVRHDFDLPISHLRNRHRVAKIPDAVLNLDLVVEEFLEGPQIKDLVAHGLGAIDGVLKP
jgi:hypothetical protein